MAVNIQELRYGEGDNIEVHNKYEGRTIDEIAKTENKHPIDVFLTSPFQKIFLRDGLHHPKKLI